MDDYRMQRLSPPPTPYDYGEFLNQQLLAQQWEALRRHDTGERYLDGINWGAPRADGDDPRDHSYSYWSMLNQVPARGGG